MAVVFVPSVVAALGVDAAVVVVDADAGDAAAAAANVVMVVVGVVFVAVVVAVAAVAVAAVAVVAVVDLDFLYFFRDSTRLAPSGSVHSVRGKGRHENRLQEGTR